MPKHQFRSSLAAVLGIALAAGSISSSQAETMKKPSSTPSGGSMSKPVKKTPPSASSTPTPETTSTIVDLAVASTQFKTLVAAVKAADLVDTLSGPGPFTLFAPNDQAFSKLPKGTLQKLLKPENKMALQRVLKYHLLSGVVAAKDVKPGNVATIEGKTIRILVSNKRVKINNANVIKTDIKASNGIVHTIDTVLIPPNLKLK